MATFLRNWSYRYQWLYDTVSRFAALSVGGERRFRQLALEGVTIAPEAEVLDLCCGSGQTTQLLVQHSRWVTGLDASPRSLARAKHNVPQANYVEGWAENMPFADQSFDGVHTSVALHEMKPDQLQSILTEVYRVLRSGGWFALIDFHQPTNPLFVPGISLFLLLFETETAWQLLETDLVALLDDVGFQQIQKQLYAGGSLQAILAWKH